MTIALADIHVRVDSRIKTEAERNFAKCGTTMTRFISDVLRSFNRDFRENSAAIEGYSVPENLRIETREQLVRILRERMESEQDYYTMEQAREVILGGRKTLGE